MKRKRCISKSCGTCLACIMRQRWADGVIDGSKTRLDRWTPEEDALIRYLAGRVAGPAIVVELERAGFHRTLAALRTHASSELGIYLGLTVWTNARISHLFGANDHTVRINLRESGLLPAQYIPAGSGTRGVRGEWRYAEADLDRFIRTCPWAYDAARMQPASHRLARLAREIQLRDPWIPARDVRRELGLTYSSFSRWVEKGIIPARRRLLGLGHCGYVVRAADIPEIRRAIATRRIEARTYLRDNMLAVVQQRRAAARLGAVA